jgi:TIR domain
MAHDVFICYASADKAIADAIWAALDASGIRCWIAPRHVLPGIPYGEALIDAIHNSRIFVLVFSSASNRSPQVMREVERAASICGF